MPIYIDFETRSECDLPKAGAWKYSEDPSTEVLCMAWAVDDGEVHLWKPGMEFPYLEITNVGLYEAHNAFFERAIWLNVLKLPPVQWSCSAAQCAAHSLPRSLDKAGEALGLSIQKDQEGKRVMMKMCKPRKPTKNNPAKWHEKPEDFETLYAYCMDDVRAERALSKSLAQLSEKETKIWNLDQTINQRGIHVDMEAVNAAIKISEEHLEKANAIFSELTGGFVERASEASKIVQWCQGQGAPVESVAKQQLTDILSSNTLPQNVRKVLELRQKVAKTSVAKYKAIKNAASSGNRLRDLLMYHGANTGRWTGKTVQPQNFPRNDFEGDEEEYFAILKQGNLESFSLCYPDVMGTISSCIRGVFIPSDGKDFYGGDYSSIEARCLPWLAGDEGALKVFREGKDIYKDMAVAIYDINYDVVTKEQRQLGKQAILGLGYGMGGPKFQQTCAGYGIEISEDKADEVKNIYRNKYHLTKEYWYAVERAAVQAIKEPGSFVKCGKIGWGIDNNFLCCKLPSGRLIRYYKPVLQQQKTPWGDTKLGITYMSQNSVTRKWEETRTYGGKLVENITQGVARDVMAEAMLRVEEAGYEVVLSVHDELVTEADHGSVKEFEKLMATNPEWGKDIPLEVEGWSGVRYGK